MSEWKSILVQMDSSPRSQTRLDLANRLALAQGASVTALYPQGPSYRPPIRRGPLAGELVPAMQAMQDARLGTARAQFDRMPADQRSQAVWSSVQGDQVAAFSRQALVHDLLVLGQHEPEDERESDLADDFAESVLIASGKPALVVPYVGLLAPVGKVVLVAWKASSESARALAAALPLLRGADKVHLATWDDPAPRDRPDAPIDVVGYLARHDVRAELRSYGPASRELGEHLLSLAVDIGAGLLVMGCYGQSRAREWALGGATRTVLQSMTMPVLMAY